MDRIVINHQFILALKESGLMVSRKSISEENQTSYSSSCTLNNKTIN
jgi:hypothetical protein